MVEKKMKKIAKAIMEDDAERVEELDDEIIQERRDKKIDLEEIAQLDKELLEKIQKHGIDTVEKLAKSSLSELIGIPDLREGKAKKVLESARKRMAKKLTDLPRVGKETAKEILKHGYASLQDIKIASIEDLSEIPKIGKKSAEEIRDYAVKNAGTELGDLPGVGKKSAEAMKEKGFTHMQRVADASSEEIMEVPNIGSKGAEEILKYAKENPQENLKNLPNVSEKTAKEMKKHGFTLTRRVADSSVEELTGVPNVGKEGAKKIKECAREKLGGRIEELSNISEDTIEELKKRGYHYTQDIAKSSISNLIEVPGLDEGRAKDILESVRKKWEESGEIKGYRRALEGISTAVGSSDHLKLARKIAEGEYSKEELEGVKEEKGDRAEQEFRPPNERGFNEAWHDILEAVIDL